MGPPQSWAPRIHLVYPPFTGPQSVAFWLLAYLHFKKNYSEQESTKQHRWRRRHLPAESCLRRSDSPRHAEYSCGLRCGEKMGMNNKRRCDNTTGHSTTALLLLRLPSTCEWKKGTKIKSPHTNPPVPLAKKGGTPTILHFRYSCGYFHLEFKWIRRYNDFKSLLCLNEC